MRDAARLCGVERVKDDAARPRVQEMMQRIRNSSGAAAAKAKAEEAFEKYEATFSVTVAISAAKVGGVRRRLIGKKKPGALFLQLPERTSKNLVDFEAKASFSLIIGISLEGNYAQCCRRGTRSSREAQAQLTCMLGRSTCMVSHLSQLLTLMPPTRTL